VEGFEDEPWCGLKGESNADKQGENINPCRRLPNRQVRSSCSIPISSSDYEKGHGPKLPCQGNVARLLGKKARSGLHGGRRSVKFLQGVVRRCYGVTDGNSGPRSNRGRSGERSAMREGPAAWSLVDTKLRLTAQRRS